MTSLCTSQCTSHHIPLLDRFHFMGYHIAGTRERVPAFSDVPYRVSQRKKVTPVSGAYSLCFLISYSSFLLRLICTLLRLQVLLHPNRLRPCSPIYARPSA